MRIATAVMVTRGDGADLEVLLVERAPELKFFGGYWAFPGGVIDDCDHDGDPDAFAARVRCGIRELFEETGFTPTGFRAPDLESLRGALLENRAGGDFRQLLDACPGALDEVSELGHLTTPPFAPRRYRTQFLQRRAPERLEPAIERGELVDGGFFRVDELLEEWRAGARLIVPPVVYILRHLRGKPLAVGVETVRRACETHEAGRLHEIRTTPGVLTATLVTPTIPPATTTNCYVVGERDLYVVDPATYETQEQQRLFELLERRADEGGRVAGVLVTHHHPDHVGAVDAVATRYKVPVYAHPRTLERLPVPPHDPRELNDGDVIELGVAPDGSPAWKLTAYHTPGHDQGHLVFVESRYRALIAGDLVSTISTIVIDPPEGHLATYLASLERMRALNLGVLYPSHGPVARQASPVLAYYLKHRAKRERALIEALDDGVTDLAQLVARVYIDTPPELHGLARKSLLAGIEKLREEGRSVELAG